MTHRTNEQLRAAFYALEAQGATLAEMTAEFGAPPWHFLDTHLLQAPSYRLKSFVPQWKDSIGRLYTVFDPNSTTIGCKIPIKLRRENPAVDFPAPGDRVELTPLSKKVYPRIISIIGGKARTATAILEIERIE